MNWMARNFIVVLCGTATSVLVAAALVFLEARSAQLLFSFSLFRFVPVGAILVGCVGAVGYLLSALLLRLRPGRTAALVILAIAAGIVFLVQSTEFGLFLGGPVQAAKVTRSAGSFSRFMAMSVIHTPLEFWSTDGSDDAEASSSSFFSPGTSPSAPQVGNTGDSRADALAGGIQGMMASQDVSNTKAGRQMTQMSVGFQSIGAHVENHGAEWIQFALETLGFAVGGLAVFWFMRSLPHCKDCMLLLATKGERTRYFSRSRDMRSSVDDVLLKARDRQLQPSIQAHLAKGSAKRTKWAEYCSTLEIQRCMQCHAHRMNFRAMRRDGATWKNIDLLGFSTSTLEPIDFA